MVNEFKLAVIHFVCPNRMQTCAWAWIYCWTKNGEKSGPGRQAIIGRGPLGPSLALGLGPLGLGPLGLRAAGPSWAVGRGPVFSKTQVLSTYQKKLAALYPPAEFLTCLSSAMTIGTFLYLEKLISPFHKGLTSTLLYLMP